MRRHGKRQESNAKMKNGTDQDNHSTMKNGVLHHISTTRNICGAHQERIKLEDSHQQSCTTQIYKIIKELMLWWVWPILQKGCKQDLSIEDLPPIQTSDKVEYLGDLLEKNFQREAKKRAETESSCTCILWRALWKTFGRRYIKNNVAMLVQYLFISPILPVCLGVLVRFFSGDVSVSAPSAYLAAGVFIFGSLTQMLTVNLGYHANNYMGMQVRIACSALIYRKALTLPQYVGCDYGKVINLLSSNVNRFHRSPSTVIFLVIAPLQGLLVTFILWWFYIGAASVFVPVFLLLALPFQAKISQMFSSLSSEMTSKADERIKVTSEALHGIVPVRMNAWEDVFEERIENARRCELGVLKKFSVLQAVKQAFFTSSGKNIIAAITVLYLLTNKQINTDTMFVLVAYLNLIQENITISLPVAMRELSHSHVSVQRIQSFLLQKKPIQLAYINEGSRLSPHNVSIALCSVKASWKEEDSTAVLEDITFTAEPGCLVGITGVVASGKSALLQTVIGELFINEGEVNINGSIAYVSQDPWIFPASLRENIILGKQFQEKKFNEIIRVCALDKDLLQMAFGNLSHVGERGSKLSGGQRTRVALARALYSDADIYVLDDIMSSLDARTKTFIFHECIVKFLASKTRLFVSSHEDFIKKVDKLILLHEGKQIACDNQEDIYHYNYELSSINHQETMNDELQDNHGIMDELNAASHSPGNWKEVSLQTFVAYLWPGFGTFGILLVLFLCLVVEGLHFYTDFWIRSWPDNVDAVEKTSQAADRLKRGKIFNWVCVYVIMVLGFTVVSFCRSLLFYLLCTKSSAVLHSTMIKALLATPVQYFKKTPTGKILHNLSQELSCVDDSLPNTLLDASTDVLRSLSVFLFIGMTSPVVLSLTLIVIIPLVYAARCFLIPSGCITRLEKAAKESLLSHVSSTLLGLTTIRSSKAEPVLRRKFYELQDIQTPAWYTYLCCARFLSFLVEGIMLIYMIFVVVAFFIFPDDNGGADLALCLILLVQASADTHWMIRMLAETTKEMVSVEKILSFKRLSHEDIEIRNKIKSGWPHNGMIHMKNVSLTYQPGLPAAIRDISLQVKPKQKIGVIGRTGSGKTSLLNALLKMAPTEGEIYIDNVNIATISVHQLRKRISVISQEPFLFNTSIRMNLDPTGKASDQQVLSALRKTHLSTLIASLPNGVNTVISKNGKSLSAGEQQLMCLARAIVKKSRIIILDEATANIDQRTDALIRKTVTKEFKNCSVITIAHKLQTVMDCDRIITMANGKIKSDIDNATHR